VNDRAPALRIETAVEGRTVCLALLGELTYVTTPVYEEHETALHGAAHPHVVLDVGRLTFCDSVGLSALLGTVHRARLHGGGVTLRGLQGALQRALHVTGVGGLFTVLPVYDAAAAAPGRTGEPA
jgi:anti-sigma B factor antagonist